MAKASFCYVMTTKIVFNAEIVKKMALLLIKMAKLLRVREKGKKYHILQPIKKFGSIVSFPSGAIPRPKTVFLAHSYLEKRICSSFLCPVGLV